MPFKLLSQTYGDYSFKYKQNCDYSEYVGQRFKVIETSTLHTNYFNFWKLNKVYEVVSITKQDEKTLSFKYKDSCGTIYDPIALSSTEHRTFDGCMPINKVPVFIIDRFEPERKKYIGKEYYTADSLEKYTIVDFCFGAVPESKDKSMKPYAQVKNSLGEISFKTLAQLKSITKKDVNGKTITNNAHVASIKTTGTYLSYITIQGTQKGLFSSKVSIEIDNGAVSHGTLLGGNKLYLVGDNGKKIVFNSMTDALNYLGKLGWKFEQAFVVTDKGQNVYSYIMSKVVSSDDEARKGFITYDEYQKLYSNDDIDDDVENYSDD